MAKQISGGFRSRFSKRVSDFTEKTFVQDKLNNWLGYLFITGLACLFGVLLSKDMMAGLGLFGGLAGICFLVLCFTNVEAGFYVLMFVAFFAYFFSGLFFRGNMPIGIIFDCLVLVNFLGLLFSRKDFRISLKYFSKIPVVIYFCVIFFYNIVEMFNPNSMGASATNVNGLRKFLDYIIILFTAYMLLDSLEKIRKYTIMLLIAASLCAFYGCLQQWHGLFDWELQQIMSDPLSFGLLFVNGEFRKFGTMSDPSAYGLLMSGCTIFFLILSIYEKKTVYRLAFIGGSILMILATGYSGTRTAYATMLAGLGFFVLLNIDKPPIQKFGLVTLVVFLILLFGPFSSISTVRRFRTTFIGTQDESYKVRVMSRQFIQPYIRSHPIGGGLGTTGFNGAKEHPGHFLANFMPDGSYVAKATETGWIGLALICILYYLIMRMGIMGFFKARDEKIKIYYAACLSSLFSFYVGEYAQIAIGGVTDSVVYFPFIAIMLNLKYFDRDAELRHPA